MTIYRIALIIGLAVFGLKAFAQDKTQRVRDNDKVFIIDISQLEQSKVDELKSIKYASVIDITAGKNLVLKCSKDQSTKASEIISNLVADETAIAIKKGADYIIQ